MRNLIAGIDYGKEGALAFLGGPSPFYYDLEEFYDPFDIDVVQLAKVLQEEDPDLVVIEDFLVRFRTAAHIRSLRNHERLVVACEIAEIPYMLTSAATWKRHFGLYGKKSKDASIQLANELLGIGRFRHDVAEAFLIARFGDTLLP